MRHTNIPIPPVGLSAEEVTARRAEEGFNELPQARKRSFLHIDRKSVV
jgi:hypothetical protein